MYLIAVKFRRMRLSADGPKNAQTMLDAVGAEAAFSEGLQAGRDWSALARWLLIAALLTLIYAKPFAAWMAQLWDDPNYSFGLLVIPVAAYLCWTKRAELTRTPVRPSYWGLAVLALGILTLFAGSFGAELYLTRNSLLVIILGLILFLRGWRPIALLGTPFVLTWLVIPLPQIVLARISLPLQILASRLAEKTLTLLNVPVFRDGNIISLPTITLGVIEACSGLRSMFSLAALTVLYGYMTERSVPMRLALVALSVPIAVGLNMTRVVGTGLLAQAAGAQAAEGFFHYFYGWLHFLVALGLVFAAHRLFLLVRRISRGEMSR